MVAVAIESGNDEGLYGSAGSGDKWEKVDLRAIKKNYLLEVYLSYSVVLISTVQKSDSLIHKYIHSFSHSFPLWFITGYRT